MAAKAAAGYAAFCRQDLIGADYGLLNVTTLAPATDYWLLVLWMRLMGTRVLSTTLSSPADPHLRAYAFCGPTNGTATLLLISLSETETICALPPEIAVPGSTRIEYVLTPAASAVGAGIFAADVALNGNVLSLLANGSLPEITGTPAPVNQPLSVPPLGISLSTFTTDADACGVPRDAGSSSSVNYY